MTYSGYLVNQNITSYTTITVYTSITDDSANNRSRVQLEMKINGSNYSASGVSAGLTGASDRTSSKWSGSGTVLSSDFYVNHNQDGSGNVTIAWWMNTTSGNSLPFGSTTLTLTTYPRASTPTISSTVIVPNVDGGSTNKYTLYFNKKSSSYTHDVTVVANSDGGGSGDSASSTVTKSYTSLSGDTWVFTPVVDFFKAFRHSKRTSGTIKVQTKNGSTNVGSAITLNVTFKCEDNDGTTLGTPTVTETSTWIKNLDSKYLSTTIQNLSTKTVSITSTAHNYAITKSVTCNGVALTNNNGTWIGTIDSSHLNDGNYVFVSTDSRGWKSTITLSQTYYAYTSPTFTEVSLTRSSFTTTANATLTIKGIYSTNIDNTATKVVITYIKNGSTASSVTVTPTNSGGVFSATSSISLGVSDACQANVKVTFKTGGYIESSVTVGGGQYALWLGKTEAKTSGNFSAGSNITVGGTLTVGACTSGTITEISNSYGAIDTTSKTYYKSGRVISFPRIQFILSATLPGWATVQIASGLPAPKAETRFPAFVEGTTCGFVALSTNGTLTLYHRSSSTVASGSYYRIYGACYII